MNKHALWPTVILVLGCVATTAAQERSPALSWVRDAGAEGCIALPELATRVEQRLGAPTFVSPSGAMLHVEGRISPRRGKPGFDVSLTSSDAQGRVLGRRSLQGDDPSCRALDEALVLVIALTVDSSGRFIELPEGLADGGDPAAALLAELEQAGPPAPSPPTPVGAALRQQPAPADRREQAASSRPDEAGTLLRLGFAPLLALGLIPGLGVGLELEPQVRLPSDFVLLVRGSGFLGNTQSIEGGGSLEIDALLAALGACSPAAPFWDLRACAGAQVGSLRVDASGLNAQKHPRRLLLEPWLSTEVSWPLGTGVRFRALARFTVPLIRDDIQVLDPNREPISAYRLSVATLTLGAGLIVAFGS